MLTLTPEIKSPDINLELSGVALDFRRHLDGIQSLPEVPEAGIPGVIDVRSMDGDLECIREARASLCAKRIGDVALSERIKAKQKPIRNCKEALEWAVAGDKDSEQMLKSNIAREASEYIFKAAHVSEAKLEVDNHGRILQNGQLMNDVYRNGYKLASAHSVIKRRSLAEANNGARLEQHNREGNLDTHVFVVFSRATDGMSDEEMDKLNFFSETKSLSIQATTKTTEGLKTETAFVAGVSSPGSERHDRSVIEAIGEYFEVDFTNKTAEEVIDMPVLIPKQYMKSGVIDVVKLYDDINGGTFYGQDKPRQNYQEHKKSSGDKEAAFSGDVINIFDKIKEENNKLENAIAVSKRLANLVEERMVKLAIKDKDVDVSVFGAESGENIITARTHADSGNYRQAMIHAQTAIETATGGSCPTSLESIIGSFNPENNSDTSEKEKLSWHGGKTKKGTCVNCERKTIVGVASWCRNCIKC